MLLGIARERHPGETRVAIVPEVARKLSGPNLTVVVETGAGLASGFPDDAYRAVGAQIVADMRGALSAADLVFTVRPPSPEEVGMMKPGAMLAGLLNPIADASLTHVLAARGVTAFAMELVPRITRAQPMDALSSQANLAGYRAVIEAAYAYGRAFPMMMTAAGVIRPAKVFVMGVGVAGLQAIATARRLGAVVTATDVRPAAKEQVESLGAKFIAVDNDEFRAAETPGGYAREMSPAYQAAQGALVGAHIRLQDIVITTALIPGRPAPRLVSAAQAASMRPGSVIVDMAVEQGGNVEGVRPGEVADVGGVKIVGHPNLPGRAPADASALYARNLAAFAELLIAKDGRLSPDFGDEILKACLVTPAPVAVTA